MTGPPAHIGPTLPARILEIESLLRPSRIAALGSSLDFDALVAAETARLAAPRLDTGAPSAGAVAEGATGSLAGALPGTIQRGGSVAGQEAVDAARAHLGVPYLWGGTDPAKGFDCSGLVQAAYRAIGVDMPKWSGHQATMGVEVASLDQALPGDVLVFGDPVNHVALYIGDGRMLHAPRSGEVVRIEPIDRPIASIRRIVSPDAATVPIGGPAGAIPEPAGPAVGPAGHQPEGAELRYQPLFRAAGQRWDVDPALLAAVAAAESGFNRHATSPAGAQGLMQFMPATARSMGVDPWDPASAIDGAARYLRTSFDQFSTVEEVIASYNAGRGAVARHGGIPPYAETRNYVRKVLDGWRART